MSRMFTAYPAYRDTAVEGMGRIPQHWSPKRLKHLTICLDGKRIPLNASERGERRGTIPYWGANSVVDHINDYLFDEPLVLLGEDGAPFFEPSRNVAFPVSGKIWPNNHVHVLRPNAGQVNHQFLAHALNGVPYHLHITGSTRDKLNQSDMNEIWVRWCPLDEQTQIAKFLDYETAKIDQLIDKQQQLIALLKEKRQAVISHAVTKGLNPDAPMKDSGVEWLGQVPAHWDVTKLKHLVTMYGRIGYRGYATSDIVDEGEGAIVLSPSNINERGFTLDKVVYLSWNKYYESPEIMLTPGDIMLVKTGWSFGKVAVVQDVPSPMTVNPQMLLLKHSKIDPRYIVYFLQTGALQSRIFMINSGSYMPTMSQTNVGELPVFLPSREEAYAIAQHLAAQVAKHDTIIDRQLEAIELLQERRTALISAAVTGKIDVRNWQPPEGEATQEVG